MRRFLLVDDEINVLHALQRSMRQLLRIDDLHIELFTSAAAALARCCECQFDLVISDQRMPKMRGVEFLNIMKDVAPTTVRMMLTASTEFDTAVGAINDAQVFRLIPKPWQPGELRDTIRLALQQRDRLVEAQRLFDEAQQKQAGLTAQEREARRLEEEEPGILKVKWGPDGSIIL
ncbi:response regulator [Janthinobacterium fluminis]|uniref:Response regulator n=1 Tax=Janthinobacterium fluminis TaxID=2987524 RepID=A0ABT5K512_9BURK|nr:response regulator [Janthinobacterium fluminis]MDC8760088.1 response regulator [Janthinobacterium fluminis]